MSDFNSVAREIVKISIRHNLGHSMEVFPDTWEDTLLGDFVSADRLFDFFGLLFREVSEQRGNAKGLQFMRTRDPLSLLRSPASLIVRFVEQNLRAAHFEERVRVGDPEALAELRESMKHSHLLLAAAQLKEGEVRTDFATLVFSTPPSNATLVRVFFATDRMSYSSPLGGIKYGFRRSTTGTVHFGRCEVSIPTTHKLGMLETPTILRLELRPDPSKHIILAETENLEEQVFFQQVASSIAKSPAKDAFVFVHGYNVSFEDAARRTGQIAYDLNFVGAPVFYSWPSQGSVAAYINDETNVIWTAPHFERFLRLMSRYSRAERMYIIAHSMGSRAVCHALKALGQDTQGALKFHHLVLAAPDIDADTFRELYTTLQTLAGRITLYQSSNDKALLASKTIHGNSRAGEPLLVIDGLDTIDASAIDTNFLGHSYFSQNWPLLSDIYSLFHQNRPPSQRFGLIEREHPIGKYYAFKA